MNFINCNYYFFVEKLSKVFSPNATGRIIGSQDRNVDAFYEKYFFFQKFAGDKGEEGGGGGGLNQFRKLRKQRPLR